MYAPHNHNDKPHNTNDTYDGEDNVFFLPVLPQIFKGMEICEKTE